MLIMNKYVLVILITFLCIIGGIVAYNRISRKMAVPQNNSVSSAKNTVINSDPLSIEYMRKKTYPGSDIEIEETLPNGSNYDRYIVSYKSDGFKIFALLTVPQGDKPKTGWPVIVFKSVSFFDKYLKDEKLVQL